MSPEKYLSREDILTAKDIQTEVISVPEWGGKLRVRGLNGAQRDKYQISLLQEPGRSVKLALDNATAKLVSLCVVNGKGKRLFSQADIVKLSKKSGSALNRVYTVAQRLSGLGEEDIKELTENFTEGQSDDSTSS